MILEKPAAPQVSQEPVLSVRDLVIEVPSASGGVTRLVDGASFDVMPNEVFGIVGESGSGKSLTMLAVMGLNFLGDGLIDAMDPKYRKEL